MNIKHLCNTLRIPHFTLAVAASILTAAQGTSRAEDTWTQMADMPTPRGGLTAQIVEGKIYAIGGEQSHSVRLATNETFDPATNTWEAKAAMPTERTGPASAVVGGKIYVFGGGIETGIDLTTATVEAYDPVTDTWEAKRDMPTARSGASTFVRDGKIYVMAGWVGGGIHAQVVEIYDPATDTWEDLGVAPTSAYGFYGACYVNGKFYQVGGNSPWPVYSGRSDTNVYDPAANTWERKAAMPFKKQFLSAAALNETIYAMGGSAQGTAGSEMQIYNTSTNAWTEGLPLPTARSGLATISLDGKIYAIGGYSGNTIFNSEQGTVYGTVEVFTPAEFDAQDADGDGMADTYEEANGLAVNMNDADEDRDGDGISNIDEFNANPQTMAGKADTDDDTLSDKMESNTGIYVSPTDTGTNPVISDTDNDGLADNVEIDLGTNPVNSDTDGDGFKDGTEVVIGFSPLDAASRPANPTLHFDLLGNDLTDPENDGDPEFDDGYAALFDASEEADFGGGESAFNVFDNQVGGSNDKWCCGSDAFPSEPLWVQATFDDAIVLSHFTIASADDAPGRDPTVWEIQGSNDGQNFTTIFRQDNVGETVWSDRRQVAEFRAGDHYSQPAAYSTIRFVCFETNLVGGPAAVFQIAELEFFGKADDGPDLIPIHALELEAEGIELGQNDDFFVSGFSYSSFFSTAFGTPNPGVSEMAGAIYKGNLRTGDGALLVQPTGKPVGGLSYDARTNYLYAATGHSDSFLSGAYREGGVVVYDASTGALIAEIGFGDNKIVNDLLVTEDGVYCTDSHNPHLFKIVLEEGGKLPSPPVFESIPMPNFEMANVSDADGNVIDIDLNANGIVKSVNGNQLIVVNVSTGILHLIDPDNGSNVPITIQGEETIFPNGDGLYRDGHTLYICRNFPNKIAVVQLSDDSTQGTFVRNLESPDLDVPTSIIGDGDSIYAINTNFNELMFGDRSKVQTEVVKLSKSGTDWPNLIPLNVAGFEAEGITLGYDHDFFVSAFSYSSFFLGAPQPSLQSGAIYKGNLRTGEGSLLVQPTGTPIGGLSHDPRTDYLYVAKGTPQGGVLVYQGATGALIADITFTIGADYKVINDVLVTETGVYCTDSASPFLYKILVGEGGTLPAEPVVAELEMTGFVMNPDPTEFNANGLVSSADGKQLIVINISTGVLYFVDAETGATAPISISGKSQRFVNGDGLYLDGHTLYICQNFSNKIAVVQLSEDLTEGTFERNLVSLNIDVPTTILGYGDSIYAINTHFGEITAGNAANVQTEVVRLSTAPAPWIQASTVVLDSADWIDVGFESEASTATSDFVLQATETLPGPWSVVDAQLVETPDGGYSFRVPRNLESRQTFYRIWVTAK
jgi:N-acetylneuraminic acid mutarotase